MNAGTPEAPVAATEKKRLEALRRYQILDTAAETSFDDIARLAAQLCEAPIAFISLVDRDRQVFTSHVGLDETEAPQALAFSAEAILDVGPLVVEDARLDQRFAENPLVTGPPHIRFYVGAPLIASDGLALGTLSVFGPAPGGLAARHREALLTLARQIVVLLELKRNSHELVSLSEAMRQKASERRYAEQALLLSEEGFRTGFEYSVIGMAVIGLDGHFLRVNRALCLMLGQSEDDLLAMDYPSITHPPDLERCLRQMERLQAGEAESFREQKRYVHKDGHLVWGEVSVGVVRDASGAPVHFVGNVQDITDRIGAEAALRESEQRYRSLVENVPDVIWTADATGRAVFVSPNVDRIFGFTQKEVYREGEQLWFGRIHPEDVGRVRDAHERLFSHGERFDVEYRVLRKDGEWRWWHDRAVATYERYGATYSDGILTDVTERKQVEGAAKASEERLRLAFEATKIGTGEMDLQTNQIWLSDPMQRVVGLAPGTSKLSFDAWIERTIHPDDRASVSQAVANGIATRSDIALDYRIVWPDGTVRWVTSRAKVIYDEAGRATRILGAIMDVTERKRLEEQLRQAQKMEAVGRLAGGIAHDFNNLLTVISGYGDLALRSTGEGDPVRGDVEEMLHAAGRAAALTQQLLAFSRKQIVRPRVIDLNALIANLERMLSRLIGEDVELVTDLEEYLPSVEADPGQLEQIVANLVVNARDAMPRGGRLTISTSAAMSGANADGEIGATEPSLHAVLTIADTGEGMDPETLSHLFEPFFTTKGVGAGTGLGLATVYATVQQHRGTIDVESAPGRGTIFRISLPAVLGPREEKAEAAREEPTDRGTETVLLVEDEEAVRRLAARALQQCGYTVLEASGAEEALRRYEEHAGPVDLLLTDVVMPRVSGRELAERLRALAPGIKVLYMSGYTDDEVVRRGAVDRTAPFLPKPFSGAGLTRKVREVLGAR